MNLKYLARAGPGLGKAQGSFLSYLLIQVTIHSGLVR